MNKSLVVTMLSVQCKAYSIGQRASSMGPSRGGSRAVRAPSAPLKEGCVKSLPRKRTAFTAGL